MLYNPTHFTGSLLCWIRNAPLRLDKLHCNNTQLCTLHFKICSLYVAIYNNYCEDTHQTIFHLYPRHVLGKVENWTNNDLQNIHIKLKIEEREPHYKPEMNSGAPKG
jgi:hypothetical protein